MFTIKGLTCLQGKRDNFKKYVLPVYLLMHIIPINGHGADDFYDVSIEDLKKIRVVTANRIETDITQATGIVSVITAKDIERFGANSLIEVVERFPGVTPLSGYVFQNNAVSVRGDLPNQNDTHLLVLINGRPFRTGFSGGFNGAILDNYPLRAIERLEFVRGPGSVLYGSNAYSGVLNIITKRSQYDHALISLGGGSFSTRTAGLSAGMQQGVNDVRMDATFFKEDGWQQSLTDENAVTSSDKFSENNKSLSLSSHLGNFFVDAFVTQADQTHLGSRPIWPADEIQRDAYYLGIGHLLELSPDWSMTNSLSYTGSRQVYPLQSTPVEVDFNGHADELHLESFASGALSSATKLLLGGSLTYLRGQIEGGTFLNLSPYDTVRSRLFVELNYELNSRTELTLGGQLNHTDTASADFVPRLGATWRYRDDMGLKLLYSEAFRSPYPAETSVVAGPVVGNPALEPETVRTMDLQWYFQRQNMQMALTFFDTRQKDLIRRTAGTFDNVGEIHIQGVEWEGRWKLDPQWMLTGSVTAQRNEDESGVGDVTLAPDYLAKIGIAWIPHPGASLGIYDSYADAYQDVAILSPLRTLANPPAESYHLVSANLRLHLPSLSPGRGIPDATVALYGSNLLDEDIYVPEYTLGVINTLPVRAGRAWYLTLEVDF